MANTKITSDNLDTNIDIAGTLDVTGATTLDSTATVAGNLVVGGTNVDAAGTISLQSDGDIRGVLTSGAGGDTIISAISGVSNGYQITVDSSNNQTYKWHNAGNVSMAIDSSGNVGIGTSSPSRLLEVQLTATNASLHNNNTAAVHFGSGTGDANSDGYIQGISLGYKTSGANTYAKTAIVARGLNDGAARQSLAFLVDTAADGGSAEIGDAKLTIDGTTGNIHIPKTLFVDTDTDNSVSNDEGVAVTKDGTVVIRRAATMLYMHHTAGSGTGTLVAINKAQSTVGTITATNSNAAYNTSSDYRLKENVDYDWDATTRLKQLKPARFNWIADETNTLQDGFMAHEVENIVPEAVTGIKDAVWSAEEEANGEGTEGEVKGQQMDHSKLVPLLVKTVQELEARIEALES